MKKQYGQYKPRAYIYETGDGCFALSCTSKYMAKEVMQECVDDYLNEDRPVEEKIIVSLENIKEARAHRAHLHCGSGYYTIDEPICNDCGEPTAGKGIKCHIFSF